MKLYKRVLSIVLVLIFTSFVASIALFFFNTDFQEFILSNLYREETIYAKGYSPELWKSIKLGDSREKVLTILGQPLDKFLNKRGEVTAFYYSSQGPKNTNYRVRLIIFDESGIVIEKNNYFYLD